MESVEDYAFTLLPIFSPSFSRRCFLLAVGSNMPSAAAEAKAATMDNAVDVWRLNTASRLQPGSAGLTAASGQSRQTRKIAGYPGYILPMLHEAEAGPRILVCTIF